jgi:hypothetical protein
MLDSRASLSNNNKDAHFEDQIPEYPEWLPMYKTYWTRFNKRYIRVSTSFDKIHVLGAYVDFKTDLPWEEIRDNLESVLAVETL